MVLIIEEIVQSLTSYFQVKIWVTIVRNDQKCQFPRDGSVNKSYLSYTNSTMSLCAGRNLCTDSDLWVWQRRFPPNGVPAMMPLPFMQHAQYNTATTMTTTTIITRMVIIQGRLSYTTETKKNITKTCPYDIQ